jgi:co-chaperonin GroES (HSP10)
MNFNQATLAERVIIKPLIEKETASGILLARDERSQAINTDRGEVFLVGPGAWYDLPQESRPQLKPGDMVYYAKYGAKVLKDEVTNEFYVICNDKDILVGYSQ